MAITPFASKSILEHLLRGLVGATALVFALRLGVAHPILTLALVVAMVVAFRGCPFCWTAGLIESIYNHRQANRCPPEQQNLPSGS